MTHPPVIAALGAGVGSKQVYFLQRFLCEQRGGVNTYGPIHHAAVPKDELAVAATQFNKAVVRSRLEHLANRNPGPLLRHQELEERHLGPVADPRSCWIGFCLAISINSFEWPKLATTR
jgi:hypothetical protein